MTQSGAGPPAQLASQSVTKPAMVRSKAFSATSFCRIAPRWLFAKLAEEVASRQGSDEPSRRGEAMTIINELPIACTLSHGASTELAQRRLRAALVRLRKDTRD